MTDERKIMLVDDEQTLPFYVVEETKLNGVNYLLVTEGDEDAEALYEFVEDEDELEGLMKIFEQLLEDVDLERK